MDEQQHYIRRINQHNHDLARRNGELYTALQQAAPEVAAAFTPLNDYPQRYLLIDKIIGKLGSIYNAFHEHHTNSDDSAFYPIADQLADLEDTIDLYKPLHDYWIEVAHERQKRTDQAAKRHATREHNLGIAG
jgi:hypothetical protein